MTTDDAIAFAKSYLEDILSFFGLNVVVEADQDEDVIELSVPSTPLNGFLIGEHGGNLRALQHLVSLALRTKEHPFRVNIDVADYKKQRAQRLAEQVKDWAAAVLKSGAPMELTSMSAADRRTVHKTIAEIDGIESESTGEGRDRRVTLRPHH